ncbi:MAG TPA: sulfatase-like hydrolase/transferase [Vicinamibacterales bacterium]|nr:sulfatase-like hydrolase/transferase [Vicinamibacterales bacterium]
MRRAAVVGLTLAAALAAAVIAARTRTAQSRANGAVVLISIDTLRADHLPIYGYRGVRTPAIDALAADGVVFDNAYAHAPQTLPSHASILSGRLPFETGVRDNVGFTIGRDEVLLPSMLHDAGFATAGFVSSYVLRRETGIGRGFDRFDDALPAASPEIAIGELRRDGTATLAVADAWLDGLTSSRFFLFFHIYEPHAPYTALARFAGYAPYDGAIAYADEIVGSLVASLKRRGLYDAALVVLVSDHGEGLGDHGEQEHGLFLYREAIRVPLTIKLPRQQRAGLRIATPVQHIDLVPTILDVAHARARSGLRGRTLAPLFAGGTIPEQGLYAEALYSRYHFGWSELYALTDARYAFIRAPRDELYDLQQDPGERRDLASERESTRLAMRAGLERLIAGARIDAPGGISADARERLRALGYVGATSSRGSDADGPLPDPKDRVDVLERYRTAIAQVRDGRFDAALENFQIIVRDNPRMADVWSEIGGLNLRLGRADAALAAYKRLVDVAPHDPSALINVADTLLTLGRLNEARVQAQAAAETIPSTDIRWSAKAHETLAMIALERRDPAAARQEAARAHEIDPTLPLPQRVEGLIRYKASQFGDAVPFFAAALKDSSARTAQIPGLRYYLGDALARLERYSDAEPLLRDEVRLFPSELRARASLAMLYRATGRAQESDREVDGIERAAPGANGRALAAQLRRMFGKS